MLAQHEMKEAMDPVCDSLDTFLIVTHEALRRKPDLRSDCFVGETRGIYLHLPRRVSDTHVVIVEATETSTSGARQQFFFHD